AGPLVAGAAARIPGVRKQSGKLPSKKIERILELEGRVSNGVLSIGVSRNDLGKVRGPLGVEFDGSFEIDGALTFQPLGDNLAFFNGDLPLKPKETQPFIDAISSNHLVLQAFHQHYIEMSPNVWFIHWRGVGAPLELAAAVRNVLRVTGTKLPQMMPSKPKSPLDAKRLSAILHGDAQIGDEGVVTVNVLRSDRIVIDGVRVSPEANISTNIEFKPLGGDAAWAAPDFAMTGAEVMKVVPLMRRLGWFSGCLYNQETSEAPQLYFDHMLKRGNAYSLAAEIRQGLDLTRAK
ncbi:MAG: DUF1259 domain-containing protein, partial [Solirubrobacteraceae bacterium]